MLSSSLLSFCISASVGRFTAPVIEYDDWIALNTTANKIPTILSLRTSRREDEVENKFQSLRRTYQASSGYGIPASEHKDCYLETGCSSSCGDGFRLLLPNKQAASCVSSVLQVLPCKEVDCPIDCAWGDWAPWSQCAQRSKRQTRSLARIFETQRIFNDDFTLVSEESYERFPEKGDTNHASSGSDVNSPSCSQTRGRGVRKPASNGGRDCRGERFEERYCRSAQCRGKIMQVFPC